MEILASLTAVVLLSANPSASLSSALAQEKAGNDLAAVASLERLIREAPTFELPRLEVARLRLKLGQGLDLAQGHLDVARALVPENPRAHYLWGVLQAEFGRVDEACRALETAVMLRSDYDEARFRLAGLYAGRSTWEKAVEHYRAYTQRHPEAVGARCELAGALERLGRTSEAEAELKAVWSAQPRSQLVATRLAEFYERSARPELARKIRLASARPERALRELKPSRR